MKRLALPLLAFLFAAVPQMVAQSNTHTFTFGTFSGANSGCSEFQTIDGQPANQATGDAGEVCFPYGENPWWGLDAPQSWEFPNNGLLLNNTTGYPLSAPTFTKSGCTLQTAGCVDYETGSAPFGGYGAGVTVDVNVWFVVNKHSSCGRGGCHTYYTNDETNGSGTASYAN